MSTEEILKELELYTGRFPKQAMLEAVAQREAVLPELLRVVEAVAEDPGHYAQRDDYMLLLFAIHLLAQFRETRAYRPIVKIFSAPGEIPFDLAGDTVTEGLMQILATVYDGDPKPLKGLVEGEDINEYVRSAAVNAFIVLERSGQMPREEVLSYYRGLLHGGLKRTFNYVWTGLAGAIIDLPAPELLEDLRQGYSEGLLEWNNADFKWAETRLKNPAPANEGYSLITDAIAEMENWAAFDASSPSRPVARVEPPSAPSRKPERIYVPAPKIGRNEPCPCGSGKKFKKCCGAS